MHSTLIDVPAPAAAHEALAGLRGTRRRHRLGDTEWFDLAYRVYTTVLFCLVVGIAVSGWVGGAAVSAAGTREVLRVGPAWAGLLVAALVLGGVRSGSRGGPLSVEATDVQHVLLAPIDRSSALRRPAVGVIGYGMAAGATVGGLTGSFAAQRLPGSAAAWVLSGALFGAVAAAAHFGSAMLVCSRRVGRVGPFLVALVLLALAAADVAGVLPTSPTAPAGSLMFLALHTDPLGVTWVVVAAALGVTGVLWIGGLSIEAARRRTLLVGQLRFAVTQQDLRSVVLLRRQLASERPRPRPWFPVPAAFGRRFPVTARDLQSVARWPLVRVARVGGLGIVAGLAMRGVWNHTTPLVLVAGLAAFVAGLDAIEPLAQEIDHPTIVESLPVHTGVLMMRHLVEPFLVMLATGLVGLVAAWVVDPSPEVLRYGITLVLTGAAAGVAGATVSVVSGADTEVSNVAMTAEVAGPRLVFRVAWPPLIAVIGFLPGVLAARAPAGVDPLSLSRSVAVGVLALVGMVVAWVRFRPDMHEAMAESMGTIR